MDKLKYWIIFWGDKDGKKSLSCWRWKKSEYIIRKVSTMWRVWSNYFFNGSSAIERIKDVSDLWILDIMLPDIDGYQIIKAVKENNKNTPVIFMSARNEELDRVVGLELGSDDYLSKPFLPRELIIRTNKLMERIYGKSNNSMDIITNIGEYKISRKQRTVFSEKKKFN